MKILILLHGIPGSGKSTFIKDNNLESITVSSDQIRTQLFGYNLHTQNKIQISDRNPEEVFQFMTQIVEKRMINGLTTFIDATNIDAKNYKTFVKLADRYSYKIAYIDFEISLENALINNKKRNSLNYVPESVIHKMYSQKKEAKDIKKYTKLSLDNWKTEIVSLFSKDLSNYKKVFFISDLQGCYTVLNNFFIKNPENNSYFYIFLGDYIDRGIENFEVLQFLLTKMNRKNFLFLKGNHEKSLEKWAYDEPFKNHEFSKYTMPQLEGKIQKKDLQEFLAIMEDFHFIKYNEKKIFISHSGVPFFPDFNVLLNLNNNELLHSNGYRNPVDSTFENQTQSNEYQVHGHRNPEKRLYNPNYRSFSLENSVEYGNELLILELNKEEFTMHLEKNNISKYTLDEKIIEELNNSPLIHKKVLNDHLVSYNFNRKAFYKKEWNDLTVTARGLFINQKNNKIVARSYNKFFNLNERPETQIESLNNLSYPVSVYYKHNGFLGILSYNEITEDLEFFSKSTNQSDFALNFKKIFLEKFNSDLEQLKKTLKHNKFSLIFEVIDPVIDPHIIKYQDNEVILLDAVHNKYIFEKEDYSELQKIAKIFNFKIKELCKKLNTYSELLDFITETSTFEHKYSNQYLEGYVLEDSNNFHFKIKTEYYSFWKRIRGYLFQMQKKDSSLILDKCTQKEKEILNFCIKNNLLNNNVIEIQQVYYEFLSKNN